MAFRVKDLMVHILPQGKVTTECCGGSALSECGPCSGGCTCSGCTLNSGCGNCTNCSGCSVCSDCSNVSNAFRSAFSGEVRPEHLSILKEQLRSALARVEFQERAIEESLRPQTLADVERLEQKFTEALQELKARKAELQRKGGG